jgi:outer membrane lipoprotein-sorting protein
VLSFLSSVIAAAAFWAIPVQDSAEITQEAEEARPRQESLLRSAAEGLESIGHLRADFTQRAPSGTVTTGKLYLSRPGRLRFEYDEPSPLLIVATGGLVYLHDRAMNNVESYPVGQTPMRFLLTKELDLDAAQVLKVAENEHGLMIVLAAKDKELRGTLSLLFESESLMLSGWSFVDDKGQTTIVDLDNVEEVRRNPARLFRVPEAGGLFLSDN